MSEAKKQAQELAGLGRYGDDMLLHVSKEELKGLASLMPDGKLTTNPHTGMPEAFFFLPFLAGIGGLGAATAGLGAAAGTVGAGMAAGMSAAALPAAAAAGTTAAAGTAAAGTAAGLGAAGAAALPAATAAGTTAGIGAGTAAALPAATGAAGAAAAPAMGSSLGAVIGAPGAATSTALGAGAFPAAPAAAGAGAAGTAAAAPAAGGLLGTGITGSQALQYAGLASLMAPQLGIGGGGGGGGDDEEGPEVENDNYSRGEADFNVKGDDREHNFFPRSRYFANGGLVGIGYAEGGKVERKAAGIAADQDMEDERLIAATEQAIVTQDPNVDAYIQQFIATFGTEALQALLANIEQSMAGGDGMSDSIPAMIDGKQPAALSSGEFVVPADAVSGIGNGDTNAGAQQLQGMVDRTRQMRNGGTAQPPAIDPSMVMPG